MDKVYEFRDLLIQLNNGLSMEEFHSLKFLCKDKIPKRPLEQVKTPTDLWTKLEELCILSKDNISILEELITKGCSNRKDLLHIIETYKNQGKPPFQVKSSIPSDQYVLQGMQSEIDVVVKDIGRDWRPLARALKLQESDIDYIVEMHRSNLREQSREALKLWIQEEVSKNSTDMKILKNTLVQALLICNKRSIANKLLE